MRKPDIIDVAAAGQSLTVKAAGQRITLQGGAIAEILRPQPITRIPLGPPGLLGVVNLRGQVLPIVSLAVLLGAAAGQATAETRIVVVNHGAACGLQVDAVLEFGPALDAGALDIGALLAPHFRTADRPDPTPRTVQSANAAAPAIGRDDLALVGLRVAGQDFALKLDDVVEIIALPAITLVPGADPAMLGVIDCRVGLLPLLSLRALLGLPPNEYDRTKARIVVVRIAGALAGLVIDGVTSILRVKPGAIEPVPAVLTRGVNEAQVEAFCRLQDGRLVAQLSIARLLDDATARRLAAQAQPHTTPPDTVADAATSEQFVIVTVAGELYGLPIAAIVEVVRHPGVISRVPYAPGFIEGAMNLRGMIIPVIDQHQRFGTPLAPAITATDRRVVVIRIGALQAGFAVDAASELLTIPRAELNLAPALTSVRSQMFDRIATLQRDGRMIPIVDPQTLLNDAELDLTAAFVASAARVS